MGGDDLRGGEPLVREVEARTTTAFPGARHGARQPRGAAPDRRGPVPTTAYDADRPLEAGMVISVETTLQHPTRGFIKLEDTVAVTDTGFEIFGEGARGWNRGGTAVSA